MNTNIYTLIVKYDKIQWDTTAQAATVYCVLKLQYGTFLLEMNKNPLLSKYIKISAQNGLLILPRFTMVSL